MIKLNKIRQGKCIRKWNERKNKYARNQFPICLVIVSILCFSFPFSFPFSVALLWWCSKPLFFLPLPHSHNEITSIMKIFYKTIMYCFNLVHNYFSRTDWNRKWNDPVQIHLRSFSCHIHSLPKDLLYSFFKLSLCAHANHTIFILIRLFLYAKAVHTKADVWLIDTICH